MCLYCQNLDDHDARHGIKETVDYCCVCDSAVYPDSSDDEIRPMWIDDIGRVCLGCYMKEIDSSGGEAA